MYSYFYKNLKLERPKNVGKVLNYYGEIEDGVFKGISYYQIDVPELFEIIKPIYRHHFKSSLMVITNHDIFPHIDSEVKMCINFYITTADAKTSFYQAKNNNKYKLDNQTDGFTYDRKDLIEVHSFEAKPNDIFALNVKEIHGVLCRKNEVRMAYCLSSTTLDFNIDIFE